MDIKKLKKQCEGLSVLYVEDDKDTREAMQQILAGFFVSLKVAQNGEQGLQEYRKKHYDMVISDIEMPKMNGLEMIEGIKQLNADVVTAVTTAYNLQELFLRSIELNINKYLLKPIKTEQMVEALDYLSSLILNKQKAKAFEQKKLQEKINQASDSMIQKVTASTPNPVVIYGEQRVIYLNDAFSRYLEIAKSYETISDIEALFLDKKGCLQSLKEYRSDTKTVNKIALAHARYTKYFQVIKTDLSLEQKRYKMLTLNDITKLEYQTIKLENYNKTFREYVHYLKNKKQNRSVVEADEKLMVCEDIKGARSLNDTEKNILRKNHSDAISATEYLQELDDDTMLQMQELTELNEEMQEYVAQLKNSEIETKKGLTLLSRHIARYVQNISILFEFYDLVQALHGLNSVLESLQEADETMQHKAVVFIEAIVQDLKKWEESIFIKQDTLNIHYLDSSLFSSCLQLEMLLDPQGAAFEDDEDEMEFF